MLYQVWIYSRLEESMLVKVSDFGLAKHLDNTSLYKLEDEKKELPLRWMSLEAIEDGIFSTKSDIVSFIKSNSQISVLYIMHLFFWFQWSFGVVIWEIFSYCLLPYGDLANKDLKSFLKKGYRLECPPDILDTM